MKQQAGYIALHTQLNVGQYIGDMNVDSWPMATWNAELGKNHVLVMTMTIFKNMILSNVLKFSQVNLLIFDECHHAVKNHDYVQIMRLYKDSMGMLNPTRIMGLTASLIPSKCKQGDLARKIEELENTLCCRAQTAENVAEVAKYATNPNEECLYFTSSFDDSDVAQLKTILEEPLEFLENFPKEEKDTEIYGLVKLNCEDCMFILLNLGIWCAHQFATKALDHITGLITNFHDHYDNDIDRTLIIFGCNLLTVFEIKSRDKAFVSATKIHVTDKVDKVINLLGVASCVNDEVDMSVSEEAGGALNGNGKLRAIIFAERRTTAIFLRDLIKKMSADEGGLGHIRCECVVGHSDKTGTYLRREARMNIRTQDNILSKFRHGTINLIVSTSVVEEGMDIPKCNMVVRFDFPQNLRSYIQSKGRARAKTSKYVLLIPRDEACHLQPQLHTYNCLVEDLQQVCQSRHVADEATILNQLSNEVEPYQNYFGAKCTINSALSIIYR